MGNALTKKVTAAIPVRAALANHGTEVTGTTATYLFLSPPPSWTQYTHLTSDNRGLMDPDMAAIAVC
jgi:hypothetical protein